MEPIGAISEGEWSSLSGMYITTEEADFMAQLLSNFPNELDAGSSLGDPSSFWPGHETTMNMAGINEGSYYSSDFVNTNSFIFSQGISYNNGGSILPPSCNESYYLSDCHPVLATNNGSMSTDFCMGDVKYANSYEVEGDGCCNQEMSDGNVEESDGNQPEAALPDKNMQLKIESEMPIPEAVAEDNNNKPPRNCKKRLQHSGEVQKNKRNVKLKKNQKPVSSINNEEDGNAGLNKQSSSSCCSEDYSNASQELNGGVTSSLNSKGPADLNLTGKTRASRGSATDPQSLYARKRRERINERLRILQNLVPNGTKVDISTMLEEAVQYVKFLQLQIKLLSSDDLWMYAPIAYNGMDMGLDLKITTAR